MNRRQKMKRMKQELEWYKSQCVPVREVRYDSRQYDIQRFCANVELVKDLTPYPDEEIVHKMLANRLTEVISKHMEVEGPVSYIHPIAGEMLRCRASIKLVVPYGGDRK